jgi:hypothetical protein
MSEWVSISDWADCVRMERPGIVFEIRNSSGQSMVTRCTSALPERPWDWASGPVEFRVVSEAPARRSEPLPNPAK